MIAFNNSLTPLQSGVHAYLDTLILSKMPKLRRSVDPDLRRDERIWVRVCVLFLMGMTMFLMGCQNPAPSDNTSTYAQTIYLVRHAEKQKGDNPDLTDAGHERAKLLKDMLVDKGVNYIHSSHYNRTLQTAQPLANELGMDILLYNPKDLPAFADYLKTMPGVHLVVGHSNTTPELASLLAGEDLESMPETEYDRFTTVNIDAGGKTVNWAVERFGAAE